MRGVSYVTYAFLVIAALIITLVWLKFFATLASPIVETEIKTSAKFMALQLATHINSLVSAQAGQAYTVTLPKVNCSVYIDEYDVQVEAKNKTAKIPHLVFPVSSRFQCNGNKETKVTLLREEDRISVVKSG